jgi:hypothetical protein
MSDSDGVTTPAEVASETPTVFRVGGVAVASGLVVSFVVHMALVGTVLVVSPLLGQPETVAALPVDLVTPDEVAAETKQAQDKAQDKAQQDKAQDNKPTLEIPKPQAGLGPAEAELPAISAPLASSALPIDAFAPSFDSSSDAASAPAPGPPIGLGQLLGLQSGVVGPGGGGPPSDIKADLTASQIAGFGAHVQSCWSAPGEVTSGPAVTVFVRVSLNRDGSLAGPPEPLGGSASLPAIALLRSALTALQKCQAYKDLPADKYNEWRVLDLRFSPSGISVAVPSAGNQRKPG